MPAKGVPAISQFPNSVWDGTSASRGNFHTTYRQPDGDDYFQIVAEVQSIQTRVAELLAIESGTETLAAIQSDLSALAVVRSSLVTLAGVQSSLSTLAAAQTSLSTLAGIQAALSTLAGIQTSLSTLAGVQAALSTLAGVQAALSTLAAAQSDLSALAVVRSSLVTLAGVQSDLSALAAVQSGLSNLLAGYSVVPPTASNRAPSILGGYRGNVIDATCVSVAILSGGQMLSENKMLDAKLSGVDGMNTHWATIAGGYDNIITSGYPSVIGGGAHNRVNTATKSTDPGYTGFAGAGTVGVSGTTVTGVGTSFTTQLRAGSQIQVAGQVFEISSVTSATVAVVKTSASPTIATGTAFVINSYWVTNDSYTPSLNCNHNTISGGTFGAVYGAAFASIGGGSQHTIGYIGASTVQADFATIGGGFRNLITGLYGTITGGRENTVTANYATIGGGSNNTVTGTNGYATGNLNVVNAFAGVAFGQSNTIASGCDGTVVTGLSNTITTGRYGLVVGREHVMLGEQSFLTGRGCRTLNYGQVAMNSNHFANPGDCQREAHSMHRQTADATKTLIGITGGTVNTGVFSSLDWLRISSTGLGYTLQRVAMTVVALKQATSDYAVWDLTYTVYRGSNNSTSALPAGNIVDVAPTESSGTGSAWRVSVSTDTTNGLIKVEVTGAAATNIRWHAAFRQTAVQFA
jgi:hypothetical protein